MKALLKEIRHDPLLWLLIFVPMVFGAQKLKPEALIPSAVAKVDAAAVALVERNLIVAQQPGDQVCVGHALRCVRPRSDRQRLVITEGSPQA